MHFLLQTAQLLLHNAVKLQLNCFQEKCSAAALCCLCCFYCFLLLLCRQKPAFLLHSTHCSLVILKSILDKASWQCQSSYLDLAVLYLLWIKRDGNAILSLWCPQQHLVPLIWNVKPFALWVHFKDLFQEEQILDLVYILEYRSCILEAPWIHSSSSALRSVSWRFPSSSSFRSS